MNSHLIEIISVVSLTLLGVSLFTLVISLLPILSQATKLLGSLNDLTKSLNEKILPNLAEFSEVFSGAKKMIDKGQNLSDKISKSAEALTEGLRVGFQSYFKLGSRKSPSQISDKAPID